MDLTNNVLLKRYTSALCPEGQLHNYFVLLFLNASIFLASRVGFCYL